MGHLNAYITMTAGQARAAARESERRRNGAELGPLDGVPLALKDLIDVAGVATTNGMGALRHAGAAEDAEGAVAYARYLDDPTVVFAAEVRQQLDYGRNLPVAKLVGALKARALLRHRVEALFQEVDLLISPTTPRAALSFDQAAPANTPGYMALANLCGLPALSVPMGFDADGLPLGLQLIAAPFRDPLVLRAGKAYERATDWHERRPEPVAPA